MYYIVICFVNTLMKAITISETSAQYKYFKTVKMNVIPTKQLPNRYYTECGTVTC